MQKIYREKIPDRFREHLYVKLTEITDASKPVARSCNLPNHSTHSMTVCGLSLHQENTENRKKSLNSAVLLTLTESMNAVQLIYSYVHITTFPPMA